MFGHAKAAQKQPPTEIKIAVSVDVFEAYSGTKKQITIERDKNIKEECASCNGKGITTF
jgi:DnaJ-class molecular chaperone